MHYIPDGMNEFQRNVKRIFDFIIALVTLILSSPLFAVCYVAVRREDGGPAIFKQKRKAPHCLMVKKMILV